MRLESKIYKKRMTEIREVKEVKEDVREVDECIRELRKDAIEGYLISKFEVSSLISGMTAEILEERKIDISKLSSGCYDSTILYTIVKVREAREHRMDKKVRVDMDLKAIRKGEFRERTLGKIVTSSSDPASTSSSDLDDQSESLSVSSDEFKNLSVSELKKKREQVKKEHERLKREEEVYDDVIKSRRGRRG